MWLLVFQQAYVFGQPRPVVDRPDWRVVRHPRIDVPPDPSRIRISADNDFGWIRIAGQPGAAADDRAKLVRCVNLATADEVATTVDADGSFALRLFAPPGSTLQISTLMLAPEDLPFELREAMRRSGFVTPSDMPHAELYLGLLASHLTSSPGTILPRVQPSVSSTRWPAFVRKVGRQCWLLGSAEGSTGLRRPGFDRSGYQLLAGVRFACTSRLGGPASSHRLCSPSAVRRCGTPALDCAAADSDVLTPTGLPIETHGEMIAEPRPEGACVEPGGNRDSPAAHAAARRNVGDLGERPGRDEAAVANRDSGRHFPGPLRHPGDDRGVGDPSSTRESLSEALGFSAT